jgi:hypothetical protein
MELPSPPVVSHGKFDCAGTGLTVSSHKRASKVDLEFAVGIQAFGRILPNAREKTIVEKHPKAWWKHKFACTVSNVQNGLWKG